MEGHDDTQDAQTSQDYIAWTGTSWDHADNCDDASWWTNDLSTDLWADPGFKQAARRTVQSNAQRQDFNVRRTVDVRGVSW